MSQVTPIAIVREDGALEELGRWMPAEHVLELDRPGFPFLAVGRHAIEGDLPWLFWDMCPSGFLGRRFTQQFPAFFPGGAKAEFYFDIFNVGNLLNSNWGVLNQVGFPYFASDVTTSLRACGAGTGCAAGQTNQYVYQSFTAKAPTVSNFTVRVSSRPYSFSWKRLAGENE